MCYQFWHAVKPRPYLFGETGEIIAIIKGAPRGAAYD